MAGLFELLIFLVQLLLLTFIVRSIPHPPNSVQQQWRRWQMPYNKRIPNGPSRTKYYSPRKDEIYNSTTNYDSKNYYKGSRKIPPPLFRPPPPCFCGVSNNQKIRGRIVGGRETEVMAYPWVTHLTHEEGYFICGGTLITDRHVVTAAHCLRNVEIRTLLVTVGDHDRSRQDEAKSVTVRAMAAYIHSGYVRATFHNDIAVIVLCRPVLTSAIRPICLPPPGINLVDKEVTVVGWGKIDDETFLSNTLHEVGVKVVSRDVCLNMPLEPFETFTESMLTESMICAGVPQGGKDACQGDSGGAMMWQSNNRWYFVGIVSKGFGCAEPGRFGIYTRVDHFHDWLRYITHGGLFCRY